jgi:hypothetical protein
VTEAPQLLATQNAAQARFTRIVVERLDGRAFVLFDEQLLFRPGIELPGRRHERWRQSEIAKGIAIRVHGLSMNGGSRQQRQRCDQFGPLVLHFPPGSLSRAFPFSLPSRRSVGGLAGRFTAVDDSHGWIG